MVNTTFAPYFDDYDETKNYHKVLFKPRVGVQVRELNQLQTMFQKQIERFGSHIFENGSMVANGESNYDYAYEYVTLTNVDYAEISEILSSNTVTVEGDSTGVIATVVQHVPDTLTDPVTFYLKYDSSGTAGESRFADGETLTLSYSGETDFAQATAITTGQGSVFSINAGIFYFNGDFIRTDAQRIVLGKYTSQPSSVVGFRLTESIVDWTADDTLVDVGNKNAIGADRLKKVLALEVYGLNEVFDRSTFIELGQFEEGVERKKTTTSTYSVLADTMARRTYDESGDYTVTAFNLRLREHLNANSNGGLFDAPVGDEAKFVVGVEPGKAYVRGYEVENFATRYIDVDKARATGHLNNTALTVPVGNYIAVTGHNVLPVSNSFQTVTFYSGVSVTPGAVPPGTVLGTASVRYSALGTTAGQLLVYLFNVRSAAGTNDTSFIATAKSVYAAGTVAFTANLLTVPELVNSVNHGLTYTLPVNVVKTLAPGGVSDTSFSVIRQYTATSDSSGTVVLSAGTNESFAAPTAVNSVASYKPAGAAVTREIATISTLGGVPVGSSLTIALGAGAASLPITINVEVIKQQAVQKTKTKTVASVTKTAGSMVNRKVQLDKADVYKIVSVVENGVDKTSRYKLNTNITSEYYGVSNIELLAGESLPTNDLVIDFEYYLHGAGDYFNVDSYSTVAYPSIPVDAANNSATSMADMIDFRPRFNDAGTAFTGTGASFVEVPAPYTLFRCDLDQYLPRVDKVYVDSKGTFGVIKGVPAINPAEPNAPDNTMTLYKLIVPAYTKSVTDIQSVFINNRRYTMRDIGKLEDRIANIEYYTSLSLLETETNSMQITDPSTGLNRFKNGFVTDGFSDYSVANSTVAEFNCNIDSSIMSPGIGVDFVGLTLDPAYSTGAVQTGSLITLPYTERVFLSQLLASDALNINPYAVYRWNGTLTLNPSSDVWYDSTIIGRNNVSQTVGNWSSTAPSVVYTMHNGANTWTTTNPNDSARRHSRVGSSTTTTTQNVVTTSSSTITNQVGTSDIPYMRSREVAFSAQGLMPFSRVYAFFDDVNVTAHCKQGVQAYGAPMYVNSLGNISGTFLIPNTTALRFRTGTKQFTLIDNANNVRETSLSYTGASYTAKGTLNLLSQTVVTTTNISQVSSSVVKPWDPLAQSFFVEKSGGVFVTSIEVFFKTKDTVMPVSIQIRDMEAGVPGKNIVPYSTVSMNPSQVNVSTNGTVSTKFVMESPVYLADGNEYCFVLMSNSNNYNAFIATMGRPSLVGNVAISKQPAVGVLFKSQNNSTWSEDQLSDMKFKINTAKFSTDSVFSAGLKMGYPDRVTLVANPMKSTAASNTITLEIPNHGMFVGSKFVIEGVDVGPGIPLGELNAQQTVFSVIDPDHLTFKTTTNATTSGSFGGAVVTSGKSMAMAALQPIIENLTFDQTEIVWTYRGTTGQSTDGTETPYQQAAALNITPGANNLLAVPHVVPNSANDSLLTAPAGIVTAGLVSFVDNISPVIDMNRAGIIGIVNRINNPTTVTETAATGGNAYARYLTKVIGLANAANALKLFVDVNQPQGSNFLVFYRTGNTEQEVNDKVWAAMPAVSTKTSTDPMIFNEFQYAKDALTLFSFYQFKIVMTSNSSCNVPMAKRLRGLALGT
jgi:hypothetical protein